MIPLHTRLPSPKIVGSATKFRSVPSCSVRTEDGGESAEVEGVCLMVIIFMESKPLKQTK